MLALSSGCSASTRPVRWASATVMLGRAPSDIALGWPGARSAACRALISICAVKKKCGALRALSARRCATIRRTGLNGTRRSVLATERADAGPAWAATSFSTMRPAGPEPATSARFTSSMRAARRASGVARIEPEGATVEGSGAAIGRRGVAARSRCAAAAGVDTVCARSAVVGDAAPASPSVSIQPTTVPTATGSPVIGARSRMTPLPGDSTSITDLLVSMSNRIWP